MQTVGKKLFNVLLDSGGSVQILKSSNDVFGIPQPGTENLKWKERSSLTLWGCGVSRCGQREDLVKDAMKLSYRKCWIMGFGDLTRQGLMGCSNKLSQKYTHFIVSSDPPVLLLWYQNTVVLSEASFIIERCKRCQHHDALLIAVLNSESTHSANIGTRWLVNRRVIVDIPHKGCSRKSCR